MRVSPNSPGRRWLLSGRRLAGRGSWIVLDEEHTLAQGTLERPNDGAISDSGRFILTGWLFGGRPAGMFYAMAPDGAVLIAERLGANARTSAISPDGRFAAVATAANPDDATWSLRLLVFNLDGRRRLWAGVIYLARVARFVPRPNADGQVEHPTSDMRWWGPEALAASGEVFSPRALPRLLSELLRSGPPRRPLDAGV